MRFRPASRCPARSAAPPRAPRPAVTSAASPAETSFGATGAQIGAGAGNALVFTVPVGFTSGMTTDPLVNTATAADVPSGVSASGADSNARAVNVSLAVVKTDGSTSYTPGGTATYTITVTNGGTSDALGVTVADALPPGSRWPPTRVARRRARRTAASLPAAQARRSSERQVQSSPPAAATRWCSRCRWRSLPG